MWTTAVAAYSRGLRRPAAARGRTDNRLPCLPADRTRRALEIRQVLTAISGRRDGNTGRSCNCAGAGFTVNSKGRTSHSAVSPSVTGRRAGQVRRQGQGGRNGTGDDAVDATRCRAAEGRADVSAGYEGVGGEDAGVEGEGRGGHRLHGRSPPGSAAAANGGVHSAGSRKREAEYVTYDPRSSLLAVDLVRRWGVYFRDSRG